MNFASLKSFCQDFGSRDFQPDMHLVLPRKKTGEAGMNRQARIICFAVHDAEAKSPAHDMAESIEAGFAVFDGGQEIPRLMIDFLPFACDRKPSAPSLA